MRYLLLVLLSVFTFGAQAVGFGLLYEGNWAIDGTTLSRQNLFFQISFIEHSLVSPYIGVGLGSGTVGGAIIGKRIVQGNNGRINQYLNISSTNFLTEVGAEFTFDRVRLDLFLGYDMSLGGSSIVTYVDGDIGTANAYLKSGASLNMLKVGARIFYAITDRFDLGLNLIWFKMGHKSNQDKSGLNPHSFTQDGSSSFTIGIPIRFRF